ncbi:unnamed protein product [Parajaminaea phylloscopi]
MRMLRPTIKSGGYQVDGDLARRAYPSRDASRVASVARGPVLSAATQRRIDQHLLNVNDPTARDPDYEERQLRHKTTYCGSVAGQGIFSRYRRHRVALGKRTQRQRPAMPSDLAENRTSLLINPAATRQPFRPVLRQSTAADAFKASRTALKAVTRGLESDSDASESNDAQFDGQQTTASDSQNSPFAASNTMADPQLSQSMSVGFEETRTRPHRIASQAATQQGSISAGIEPTASSVNSSSLDVEFSDMETETASSATESEGDVSFSQADQSKLDQVVGLIFFGTPSESEHLQRKTYTNKLRQQRLKRRDSLELARRTTLTLEEVQAAALTLQMEAIDKGLHHSNRPEPVDSQRKAGDWAPHTEMAAESGSSCSRDPSSDDFALLSSVDIAEEVLVLSDKVADSDNEGLTELDGIDKTTVSLCSDGGVSFQSTTSQKEGACVLDPVLLTPDRSRSDITACMLRPDRAEDLTVAEVLAAETAHQDDFQDCDLAEAKPQPEHNADKSAVLDLADDGQTGDDEDREMSSHDSQDGTLAHTETHKSSALPEPVLSDRSQILELAFMARTASIDASLQPLPLSDEPDKDSLKVVEIMPSHSAEIAGEDCSTGGEPEPPPQLDHGIGEAPRTVPSPHSGPLMLTPDESLHLDGPESTALVQETHLSGPPVADEISKGFASPVAAEHLGDVGSRSRDTSIFDSPGIGLGRLQTNVSHETPVNFLRDVLTHGSEHFRAAQRSLAGGPLSPAAEPVVLPLGSRDTNLSSPHGAPMTPLKRSFADYDKSSVHLLTPLQLSSSAARKVDFTASDGRVHSDSNAMHRSPQMARLRESRDAALAATLHSPAKSPKKASRTASLVSGGIVSAARLASPSGRRSPVKAARSTSDAIGTVPQMTPRKQAMRIDSTATSSQRVNAGLSSHSLNTSAVSTLLESPRSTLRSRRQDGPEHLPVGNTCSSQGQRGLPVASSSNLQPKGQPTKSGIRPPSVFSKTISSGTAAKAVPAEAREPPVSRNLFKPASLASKVAVRAATSRDGTLTAPRAVRATRGEVAAASHRSAAVSGGTGRPPATAGSQNTSGLIHPSRQASSGATGVEGSDDQVVGASDETTFPQGQGPRGLRPVAVTTPTSTLNECSPSKLRVNLSPIKLARAGSSNGSSRARRVPMGSKEALHAEEPRVRTQLLQPAASIDGGSARPTSKTLVNIASNPPAPVRTRKVQVVREQPPPASISEEVRGPQPATLGALGTAARSERSSDHSDRPQLRLRSRTAGSAVRGPAPLRTTSAAPSVPVRPVDVLSRNASRQTASMVPSVPISTAALAALTAKNSRLNQTYRATLNFVTVKIEGPRPPSPSSKFRKAAGHADREQAALARADRARRRATGESDVGPDSDAGSTEAGVEPSPRTEHRLGSGDTEVYTTPPKIRCGVRGVRWRRSLYAGPHTEGTAGHGLARGRHGARSRCLALKDFGLDRHGNVRATDAPPSPHWSKTKVVVRKLVYDDDDDDDDDDEGGDDEADGDETGTRR